MIFKQPTQIFSKVVTGATKSIFLAGSIEMGIAENWQDKVTADFFDIPNLDIYNPRRNDWDSSWKQDFENPQFFQQVNWELDALEKADYILMYFHPDTKAPISLLELGLFAKSNKIIVCCPKDFYRKGNVEIACWKYNIPLFTELDEAIVFLKKTLIN